MQVTNDTTHVRLTTKVGRSYLKPCMHNAQVRSNIARHPVIWQGYYGCRHKARRAATFHAKRLAAALYNGEALI